MDISPPSDSRTANIAADAPKLSRRDFWRFARTAGALGLLESRLFCQEAVPAQRGSEPGPASEWPHHRGVCVRGSGRGQAWHSGGAKSRSFGRADDGARHANDRIPSRPPAAREMAAPDRQRPRQCGDRAGRQHGGDRAAEKRRNAPIRLDERSLCSTMLPMMMPSTGATTD